MIPKFKVWDSINNRWISEWHDIFINEEGCLYIAQKNKELQGLQIEPMGNLKYMTVCMGTGLRDKNGVEIYEGDVVVDRWANEYTPVFQNGIYMAYNPKHLMQNDPSTQFNIIWKDGCEIIGNIFEHPHLLEGADE